jgi:4-coumarate--CoA ligase
VCSDCSIVIYIVLGRNNIVALHCRYPHEEAGQIPIALVVRLPGSKITEAQVMDHVAKRVAPYKKIRKVLFVDSIPKSPAGKILRWQLANNVQYSAVSRL